MLDHKKVGISDREYGLIKQILKREPNDIELLLYSAMWSEHCGYKHSKRLLKKLPGGSSGENAGFVKIEDNFIVFKVESHNHPSAVEPFQGAATGIGGIIRDIIAMGARPIALADSLWFGPIEDSQSRHIFEGVVRGISSYGNSIGVPTVAGEVHFDESYKTNPLVNVLALGVCKELKSAKAKGVGNSFVLVGSKTGRDGIHGAAFASRELSDDTDSDRPSVQVGDPFSEKELIEATLEIIRLPQVIAVQDLGAAGLLSSTSEMVSKGNLGAVLYLDRVPLREKDMKPEEIILSESQERMMFLVEKGKENEVIEIAKKHLLDASIVGETTADKNYKLIWKDEVVANVPVESLGEAPDFYRKVEKADYVEKLKRLKIPKINKPVSEILKKLFSSPEIASKKWVYRQYDHTVQTNTVILPGEADSAIMWIKNSKKGIGLTIDGNGRYVYLDPFEGSKNVVFEAARNLVATGCKPLGITDCMNFGNPEKDDVFWQFEQSILGISEACNSLKIPVTGGNVSFYNESTSGRAIYPTPVIGMVGVIEDVSKALTMSFKNTADYVYLVGRTSIRERNIGGSLYLKLLENFVGGSIDTVDTEYELKLQNFILKMIDSGVLNSAHDVSDGGLLTSICECCISGNKGIDLFFTENIEELFGEVQSRFVITVKPEFTEIFEAMAKKENIEYLHLGFVRSDFRLFLNDKEIIDFGSIKSLYDSTLNKWMEEEF